VTSGASISKPIVTYEKIAIAVGKAINRSVSERTAKRYAQQGRENRLPVQVYPDGRAYLLPADLEVWARAWLAPRASGGRPSGRRKAA
jgi:hypothetical protein